MKKEMLIILELTEKKFQFLNKIKILCHKFSKMKMAIHLFLMLKAIAKKFKLMKMGNLSILAKMENQFIYLHKKFKIIKWFIKTKMEMNIL
jgi:hypothetical protein